MEIIFVLGICLVILMPYIVCILLSTIIIWLITTKTIGSKTLKILIIMIILLYSTIILGNFKSETPDHLYIKMKEMNDNQSLIGLSEEEVVELLGKPEYKYNNRKEEKTYVYYAGKIFKESYWGYSYSHDYYELNMFFDENDKVEHTYIKLRN